MLGAIAGAVSSSQPTESTNSSTLAPSVKSSVNTEVQDITKRDFTDIADAAFAINQEMFTGKGKRILSNIFYYLRGGGLATVEIMVVNNLEGSPNGQEFFAATISIRRPTNKKKLDTSMSLGVYSTDQNLKIEDAPQLSNEIISSSSLSNSNIRLKRYNISNSLAQSAPLGNFSDVEGVEYIISQVFKTGIPLPKGNFDHCVIRAKVNNFQSRPGESMKIGTEFGRLDVLATGYSSNLLNAPTFYKHQLTLPRNSSEDPQLALTSSSSADQQLALTSSSSSSADQQLALKDDFNEAKKLNDLFTAYAVQSSDYFRNADRASLGLARPPLVPTFAKQIWGKTPIEEQFENKIKEFFNYCDKQVAKFDAILSRCGRIDNIIIVTIERKIIREKFLELEQELSNSTVPFKNQKVECLRTDLARVYELFSIFHRCV